MITNNRSRVHLYTGDGKGKTTAAMGLALRASGHGFKIYIVQFLKGGHYTGEFVSSEMFLRHLITIEQFGKACIKESTQLKLGDFSEEKTYKKPFKVRETINCGDCRYCFQIDENDRSEAKKGFRRAYAAAISGDYDLVILDEVTHAMKNNLITLADVLELINTRSTKTEIVLTGRSAPKELIDIADLVTEMKDIKHYMEAGVSARPGIEY